MDKFLTARSAMGTLEFSSRASCHAASLSSVPSIGSSMRCPGGSVDVESSSHFSCNRPLNPNYAHLSQQYNSLVGVSACRSSGLLIAGIDKELHSDLFGLRAPSRRDAQPVQKGRRRRILALGFEEAAVTTMGSVLWHWKRAQPADSHKRQDPSLEGPSCIYVGPVETAAMEDLEALYKQARDEYYSGRPLIMDEMFDVVERRLRWFGSKLVLKYPRCSLRRYSAYSDAELDQSQLLALSAVWSAILLGSVSLAVAPPVSLAHGMLHNALWGHGDEWEGAAAALSSTMTVNASLFVVMAVLLGSTVASAAARSLKGLLNGNVVALKGSCPACGEEVYAFIRADESTRPRHKCECHVCEQPLVFHATLEESSAHPNRKWAYGRIYLVVRTTDLAPSKALPKDRQ